jgi:ABC-type bacteriocin/lantibiotic exporter with double-glycine peptidase domain
MLISGIIVSIIGLINGYDLKTFSSTLIIVLIIFFLIGSIIQNMLNKIYIQVEKKEKQKQLIEMDKEINRIKALDSDNEDEEDSDALTEETEAEQY